MENKGCITCKKCEQVRINFYCGRTRLTQKQLYKHGYCSKYEPRESAKAKPMTNEEWLRKAATEQLAEWILDVSDECFDCGKSDNDDCPFGKAQGVCTCISKDSVVEWLKQPHTERSDTDDHKRGI